MRRKPQPLVMIKATTSDEDEDEDALRKSIHIWVTETNEMNPLVISIPRPDRGQAVISLRLLFDTEASSDSRYS
jgi:hypothetical protein